MVLNYIWVSLVLVALLFAFVQFLFTGESGVFQAMITASFGAAKTGFEISLGLTGVLALWLGLMKVGEGGGVISFFAKIVSPLFSRLFPQIPKNHPVMGSIFMNFSANMLGLDNAATPLGLKAMKEMQELNSIKDTASDAMIMFLVINTSGLTLIPISILVYRAQLGAAMPTDVFLPILITTFVSTLVGILAVCFKQRIRVFNLPILGTFGVISLLIITLLFAFGNMSQDEISYYSSLLSNVLLLLVIGGFFVAGLRKKINLYDYFIEGAKEGFATAIKIIPYLIAILFAVALFRSSGAMEMFMSGVRWFVTLFGADTSFVDALPTAIMKPLSGSGARGMMVDTITTFGADSLVGRMVSVIQGSTDTTFYILAVYFGSVNISKTKYAASYGLLADVIGIIVAILISYIFFS